MRRAAAARLLLQGATRSLQQHAQLAHSAAHPGALVEGAAAARTGSSTTACEARVMCSSAAPSLQQAGPRSEAAVHVCAALPPRAPYPPAAPAGAATPRPPARPAARPMPDAVSIRHTAAHAAAPAAPPAAAAAAPRCAAQPGGGAVGPPPWLLQLWQAAGGGKANGGSGSGGDGGGAQARIAPGELTAWLAVAARPGALQGLSPAWLARLVWASGLALLRAEAAAGRPACAGAQRAAVHAQAAALQRLLGDAGGGGGVAGMQAVLRGLGPTLLLQLLTGLAHARHSPDAALVHAALRAAGGMLAPAAAAPPQQPRRQPRPGGVAAGGHGCDGAPAGVSGRGCSGAADSAAAGGCSGAFGGAGAALHGGRCASCSGAGSGAAARDGAEVARSSSGVGASSSHVGSGVGSGVGAGGAALDGLDAANVLWALSRLHPCYARLLTAPGEGPWGTLTPPGEAGGGAGAGPAARQLGGGGASAAPRAAGSPNGAPRSSSASASGAAADGGGGEAELHALCAAPDGSGGGGSGSEAALHALCAAATASAHSLPPQGLVSVGLAVAGWRHVPPGLRVLPFAQALAGGGGTAPAGRPTPKAVAAMAAAAGVAFRRTWNAGGGWRKVPLEEWAAVRRLARAFRGCARAADASDIQAMLGALAALRARPPRIDAWHRAVHGRLAELVPRAPPPQLASILAHLARARARPPRDLVAAMLERLYAARGERGCSAGAVAAALHSAAALGVFDAPGAYALAAWLAPRAHKLTQGQMVLLHEAHLAHELLAPRRVHGAPGHTGFRGRMRLRAARRAAAAGAGQHRGAAAGGGGEFSLLPPRLADACAAAAVAAIERELLKPLCPFERSVLAAAEAAPQLAGAAGRQLLADFCVAPVGARCAVSAKPVALLPLPSHRFLRSRAKQLLGRDAMRVRILRALGARVRVIPAHVWARLQRRPDADAVLRAYLGARVAPRPQRAAAYAHWRVPWECGDGGEE